MVGVNQKIIIMLFTTFFVILSLINSKILNNFGIDLGLYVKGNFEFTKAIFFNVFSSLFIIIYFLLNFRKKIIIPKVIYAILGLFFISLISSSFFLTNIFGNEVKGNGLLMFINLIGLLIILINQKKDTKINILKYILFLSIIPILLTIKEYYFPTFVYNEIQNRAFGTFGHPNLLALFLLILLPFLLDKIKNNYIFFIFVLFSIAIFLSKSFIGIVIYVIYVLWFLIKKLKLEKKYIITFLFLISFGVLILIYNFGIITKLNSFISRFFIIETSLKVIFSDIKYIIFGLGNDSLQYLFDNYKSPYLYIFENSGFTADRPHNLVISILLNYGFLGLILFLYIIYNFIKNYKNNPYFHSILLFLIFNLFNFSSIIHYFFIILIISIIYKKSKNIKNAYLLKIFFIIISIFSIISSIIYYKEENKSFLSKNYTSNIEIYTNLKNENIENSILKSNNSYEIICKNLTQSINSAENNLFCGDLFWNIDKKISIYYYKKGLEKLPDMWNKNSMYYDNIFVKKLYNENRFFSEKFSNLKLILDRIGQSY
ncbi:MAG: O-antigen ligase family protein [Candidatus Gracilibacteria bacterium]|nr:O-antigen ligase family protein [Candidatus Gracilibacteria bacterium]